MAKRTNIEHKETENKVRVKLCSLSEPSKTRTGGDAAAERE